jgi:hypothetical protein
MPADDRLVGKAMTVSYGGATLHVTQVSPDVKKEHKDATDTGNYNVSQELLNPSQLPVSVAVEMAIEGFYRKSQTPSVLVAKLFDGSSTGPWAFSFTIASGYSHFSGNYDISNFKITSVVNDIVKWSATIMSNGAISPNS